MPYNCAQLLSHICLFVTPWTVAHQASLSMECLRQEFWRGLSFPTPEDLSDPEIKPESLASLHWQVDSLSLSHQGSLHTYYA